MPRPRTVLILLMATLPAAASCSGLSERKAEALVRRYNQQLVEAYRTADVELMEGLVGDQEGKKLTGLIGVKRDMGITLDAELLMLKVLAVEPRSGSIAVLTDERWRYRNRRIGTGETVGEESTDHYSLRYVLGKTKGTWVVEAVRFESPPEVGRAAATPRARPQELHGGVPAQAVERGERGTTGTRYR